MTFDNDPNRPSTRRMDPIDPQSGYDAETEPHSQPGPAEPAATQGYSEAGGPQTSYDPGTYGYSDQPPAGPPPGDTGSGSGSGSGRTVLLALLALLALCVVIAVGFLLFRGNGDDAAGPAASSTVEQSTQESTETSEAPSTTESTTSEETSSEKPSGAVTYELTGRGQVLGLRYRTANGEKFLANAGSPWSVEAQVGSRRPSLSGIVVDGTVTCKITQDGEKVSTSTSSGGPINCGS